MKERGIEIIFKENEYTWFCRNWNESTERESSYKSEFKDKKAKDWIDPVDEIVEDNDRLVINSGSRIYSYLLSEIESYNFYDV